MVVSMAPLISIIPFLPVILPFLIRVLGPFSLPWLLIINILVSAFGSVLGVFGPFISFLGPIFLLPLFATLFIYSGPFIGTVLAQLMPFLAGISPFLILLAPTLQTILPFLAVAISAFDQQLFLLGPALFPLLRFLSVILLPLAPDLVSYLGPTVARLAPLLNFIFIILMPLFMVLSGIIFPISRILDPIFWVETFIKAPIVVPVLTLLKWLLGPVVFPVGFIVWLVLSLLKPVTDIVFSIIN